MKGVSVWPYPLLIGRNSFRLKLTGAVDMLDVARELKIDNSRLFLALIQGGVEQLRRFFLSL